MRRLGGPIADLDAVEMRKKSLLMEFKPFIFQPTG
jgi:hypothetical protein